MAQYWIPVYAKNFAVKDTEPETLKRVFYELDAFLKQIAKEVNTMRGDLYGGGIACRFATTVGDGSTTTFTITHNLGTKDVHVVCYNLSSPFAEVYPTVQHTTENSVTIIFASAPPQNGVRVVILR
jgi:hypothetical protein